jgi:hypothetical protein
LFWLSSYVVGRHLAVVPQSILLYCVSHNFEIKLLSSESI